MEVEYRLMEGFRSTLSRRSMYRGIAAGPLILFAIGALPDPGTSRTTAEQYAAFYADKDMNFRVAAVLLGLGVICLLSFAAWLAGVVRRSGEENGTLPSLILAGATGFVLLLLGTVASFTAEGHIAKAGTDLDVILGVEEIGHMFFHLSGIPLALTIASIALSLRAADLAPRWTTISGLVIAPAAFGFGIAYFDKATGDVVLHQIGLFGCMLSFVWILAISISLVRQSIVHKPVFEPAAAAA